MSKDSSAKYYQENKARPQEKARERCQSLYKKEKEKKQKYVHDWHKFKFTIFARNIIWVISGNIITDYRYIKLCT